MSAPRTSIVITNYNYGRFVARCIDSALAQSYPNTEVVVVDDASRDNSREIIQSYGRACSRYYKIATAGKVPLSMSGFGLVMVTWCSFSTLTTGCTRMPLHA